MMSIPWVSATFARSYADKGERVIELVEKRPPHNLPGGIQQTPVPIAFRLSNRTYNRVGAKGLVSGDPVLIRVVNARIIDVKRPAAPPTLGRTGSESSGRGDTQGS